MINYFQRRSLQKKKDALLQLANNRVIGVTGRVRDWLLNSESRYPISCTVLQVEDSMEGMSGIEYSWHYVSKALRFGAGVALDLSKLRANGVDNGKGLVASGAVSFASIYSVLNEVLRRGGVFKNGAVVVYLDATHPDIEEFLTADIGNWVKKAVYINDDAMSSEYILKYPEIVEKLLQGVRNGTIWLAKKRWYDPEYKEIVSYPTETRLLSNVCMEILIESRASCLLSHVNLGQCTLSTIANAMVETMTFLCKLHEITGAGNGNYYLPQRQDKQVGMGVFGLANLLARLEISYSEFTDALEEYISTGGMRIIKHRSNTMSLVQELMKGYREAAKVARKYGMRRAFTIAPCATVSYRYEDLYGYTTAPEISPPICHPTTKRTQRDSSTFGVREYQYPPNVETAQDVGWDTYYRLTKAWQWVMNSTGLGHSISFNVWNSCPADTDWFKDWLQSPLVTTYYRMMVEQSYVDKTTVNSIINPEVDLLADDHGFFVPDDEEYDGSDLTPGQACAFNSKPGECSACAE